MEAPWIKDPKTTSRVVKGDEDKIDQRLGLLSQPYFEKNVRMRFTLLKWGTWESFETPESSEFDYEGQNSSPWRIFYIIGKLLNCRCPKWAGMTHLDIYNTSYDQKKGRESNWQFDSRPLKVKNRPNSLMFRWHAIRRWKALDEGYHFGLDLVLIGGLHQKL
jgi:hypothetical protein